MRRSAIIGVVFLVALAVGVFFVSTRLQLDRAITGRRAADNTAKTLAVHGTHIEHKQNTSDSEESEGLRARLLSLDAPYNSIPVKPISPKKRPLPSGYLPVLQELKWRALYDPDPKRARAALRITNPHVTNEQLDDFLDQIRKADDNNPLPPIATLQDPRAIPDLRQALERMQIPRNKWYVLEALYACGDWNHPEALLELIRGTEVAGPALRLLGLYHPEMGEQLSLEVLGLTSDARYGFAESPQLYKSAILTLERMNDPRFPELLLKYIEKWPGDWLSVKAGDHKLVEAEASVRLGLKQILEYPDPQARTPQTLDAYYYALAQFGDLQSVQWLTDRARLYLGRADSQGLNAVGGQESGKNPSELHVLAEYLTKLGKPETLMLYAQLLSQEGPQSATTVDPMGFLNTTNPAVVDALALYFDQKGDYEKRVDLSYPKRALALFPDNPKAMRLLEEFVPDPETRADLLSIAREFGQRGLSPNTSIWYGTEP